MAPPRPLPSFDLKAVEPARVSGVRIPALRGAGRTSARSRERVDVGDATSGYIGDVAGHQYEVAVQCGGGEKAADDRQRVRDAEQRPALCRR